MLSNYKSRISVFNTILVALLLLQGAATTCMAAGELSPGEMLKEATRMIQIQNYDEAIDYLSLYLDMAVNSRSERVLFISQDVRFKLATIMLLVDRKEEAAEVLSNYIDRPFAKRMRQAHKMRVACYLETEQFAECISAAKSALEYNENPVEVARIDADIEDPFPMDAAAAEAKVNEPYTAEEIEMIYFAMGDSYFKLDQMEECIEPYTYVIDHTSNQQSKGYCIMQVINALTVLQEFDRIVAWVPQLYRTPARYDIRVNIALLGVASALYEVAEYDSALPLYRMIVPRDELIEYQQKRVRQMRLDAGLPPELGEPMTPDEQVLFGVANTTRSATENPDIESIVVLMEDLELKKPQELKELEGLLDALKNMASYENHVYFQTAQLYKNVERFWEAIEFYKTVYAAEPTSLIGERSIYEAVALLMDKLAEREDAEQFAFSYLDEYKQGQYPRLVTYVLIRYYQLQKDWKSIKAIAPYIAGFEQDDNPEIIKFDAEMNFMQAVADLMLQSYSNAVQGFQYVIEAYPGTSPEGNSLFWCGFSYLCLDEYENAYNCFERYTRDFPNGNLLDEAYFQGGISLFGLDRLDEAKERFSYVIDTFGPESSVYPDSSSRRGDILGAEGGDALDLAVADYRNAFEAAKTVAQATYATFQMCEIFKADDANYGAEPIIQAVNLYLARWGSQGADLSKALFWLGRTKIQQKKYEEAADSYLEAIIDYGGELRQDGVDLMLPELIKLAKVFLSEEQRNTIKTRIRLVMESTDNEILKLRLRVALAQFDGTEIELGKQLINELPNLENASPPVLSAICNASFEIEDYSRAEEMLRTFKYNFEDSQYMRSAYKLRASGQYAAKDYEGAMLTIADAQAEYGTEPDVSWAQLMKADILLRQGDIAAAREENKNVFGVPLWRGEPEAQAIFQLGQVEEAAGNPRLAHGYYQRAYFQYKGHANGYWAAEGYLASARCLKKMSEDPDLTSKERSELLEAVRNTYRAMLYDRYVNQLPQAEIARQALSESEVAEINALIDAGIKTNIVVDVDSEIKADTEPEAADSPETPDDELKAAGGDA
jgi:TolA-binding protein